MIMRKINLTLRTMGLKSLLFNGINYIANIRLPEKVITLPRSLQLEVTNRCNLRCYMCSINELKREQTGDLSFEDFKRIMHNFNYWHSIKLSGIGEPFLNNDLLRMIDYEKKRGNHVIVYSNGLLINESISEGLIKSGLDTLFISIDASTKEKYEFIRRGGKFDILIKNLRHIQALKKRFGAQKPELIFNTTIMQKNKDEIIGLFKLMNELDIKKMNIQEVQVGKKGMTVPDFEALSSGFNIFLRQLKAKGAEMGIDVVIPVVKKREFRENCVSPWLQSYITYEGYVTPCCRNISGQHYVCGNVLKEPFRKIWNNDKYRSFRRNLRDNRLPAICVDCTAL